MKLSIDVWRQAGPTARGAFETYELDECDPRMSVLELLDHLNDVLASEGQAPVAFESDCREGICGACGILVDGRPHGWHDNLPACHQRIGQRPDGERIRLEPYRSAVYPIIRDLVVDRSVLDEVTLSGAFSSVDTGLAPQADAIPIAHDTAEAALDLAACLGCGACVAACPNGSAALYAGSKAAHLALLPIPAMERGRRARAMARVLDEFFGSCSGYGECAKACPAGIDLGVTGELAKERWGVLFHRRRT